MGTPISLKNISYQINELTYHVPTFGVKYYGKEHDSGGHESGRKNGRAMFYDFYAMELMHSWIGSGGIKNSERDTGHDVQSLPHSQQPINYAQRKVIDDVYEQVVRGVSQKLIEYLKLAVVMEFQYLISSSSGFIQLRSALVSRYNKTKKITKEDFSELLKKHVPKLANNPDLVKRFLKFSKELSPAYTSDYKDVYNVSRGAVDKIPVGNSTNLPSDEPVADIPEPEPDAALKAAGLGEPDTTDYTQPPTDDKFADYGDGEENPSDTDPKKTPGYEDDDDYYKLKEGLLTEELINFERVQRVWKAMKKAGLTLHDIARGYNDIEWGGSYGGPKWGAGAIAMIELAEKYKSGDIEKLRGIVDHIYDLQHNTGSMLNKGPMYIKDTDLNRRYKITNIFRFIPFCSPIIAQLIKAYKNHFSKTPDLELSKEAIIASPKIKLDPQKEAEILQKGWVWIGNNYRAMIRFNDKKGHQIPNTYYDFSVHQDGKFSFVDNYKADIQVFDTWEAAQQYMDSLSSQVIKNTSVYQGQTNYGSATVAPDSEKTKYIKSHSRIQLSKLAEKLLLDAKMGWRPKSKYYKAYFNGSKRLHLYAFSDGSFLLSYLDSDEYALFNDFNVALEKIKKETADAKPYPDGTQQPTAPPTSDYAALGSDINGPLPSTNLYKPSIATPQPTFSATSALPPNATSSADYSSYSGMLGQKTAIRLTKEDEEKLASVGFHPKKVAGNVWYVHNTLKDAVKFFGDDSATVIFSSKGGKNPPSVKLQGIQIKVLPWLMSNFTLDQKLSPIAGGAPGQTLTPKATAPEKGHKAGTAFEPIINKAGFVWNDPQGVYENPAKNAILKIRQNRSSTLMVSEHPYKEFKDLSSLLGFLKSPEWVNSSDSPALGSDTDKKKVNAFLNHGEFNWVVSFVHFIAPNLNITNTTNGTFIHNGYDYKKDIDKILCSIQSRADGYSITVYNTNQPPTKIPCVTFADVQSYLNAQFPNIVYAASISGAIDIDHPFSAVPPPPVPGNPIIQTLLKLGFTQTQSIPDQNGNEAVKFSHPTNGVAVISYPDGTFEYVLPKGPSMPPMDAFSMKAYLDKIYGNQLYGTYSTDYYSKVGPSQSSYTIRLKKQDEAILKHAGFEWLPSSTSGQADAYFNENGGYWLTFWNKNIHKFGSAADLKDGEMTLESFASIEAALKWAAKWSGTVDQEIDETKSPSIPIKAPFLMMAENGGFIHHQGTIGVFYVHGPDFTIQFWKTKVRWSTSTGTKETTYDDKFLQTFAKTEASMVSAQLDALFSQAANWGTPRPGRDKLKPSGESYVSHDNAANAERIQLNEWDTEVMKNIGFNWNADTYSYRDTFGNSLVIIDTGHAEFFNQQQFETTPFTSVPTAIEYAIKFVQNSPKPPTQPVQENGHIKMVMDGFGFTFKGMSDDGRFTYQKGPHDEQEGIFIAKDFSSIWVKFEEGHLADKKYFRDMTDLAQFLKSQTTNESVTFNGLMKSLIS